MIENQGKTFGGFTERVGQHVAYIQATKYMCDGAVTSITTNEEKTKNSK